MSLLIMKALNKQTGGEMMENEKLAERLRNNDETALEEIIDRFTPLVSTIIYNLANGSMSQPDNEST